jgi:hypothetical protein
MVFLLAVKRSRGATRTLNGKWLDNAKRRMEVANLAGPMLIRMRFLRTAHQLQQLRVIFQHPRDRQILGREIFLAQLQRLAEAILRLRLTALMPQDDAQQMQAAIEREPIGWRRLRDDRHRLADNCLGFLESLLKAAHISEP